MNIDYIFDFATQTLSENRKIHTEGVKNMAVRLCKTYGCDILKAEIASICHDLYRGKEIHVLNFLVCKYNLDRKYLDNPNLAHGKIAEAVMKYELKIDDEDILNAVSYHTTGRAGMSMLEKIIFISDAIEINRKPYPRLEEIRTLAFEDINKACKISLGNTIEFLNKSKKSIDEDTIKAYEYFQGMEKK